MAHMHNAECEADLASNLSRRDRRGGPYQAYVPDTIASRPVVVPPDLAHRAARTNHAIRVPTWRSRAEWDCPLLAPVRSHRQLDDRRHRAITRSGGTC